MADKTSLKQIEGVTSGLLVRLNSLNITYAEELFAYYTAVKDEPSVLSNALNISKTELEKIIKQVGKILPKELLKELAKPLLVDEMEFGALDPDLLDNKL